MPHATNMVSSQMDNTNAIAKHLYSAFLQVNNRGSKSGKYSDRHTSDWRKISKHLNEADLRLIISPQTEDLSTTKLYGRVYVLGPATVVFDSPRPLDITNSIPSRVHQVFSARKQRCFFPTSSRA
jgi:hypothetical protein